MKHEEFIQKVATLALARLAPEIRATMDAKIVYGTGHGQGARGTCYYSSWQNGQPKPIPIVEICAAAEESTIQIAGTTIHELAHVLAGPTAGHSKVWKEACAVLGLRCAVAAGMKYSLSALEPEIRWYVGSAKLLDGAPKMNGGGGPRPCGLGAGTRGGRTRGKGSGSRLRKFVCDCNPPVIVRIGRPEFLAHCDLCGGGFRQEEAK